MLSVLIVFVKTLHHRDSAKCFSCDCKPQLCKEERVLFDFFSGLCATSKDHSFGLWISDGGFFIQQLLCFYCILIHIFLLTDSCSWSHILHTVFNHPQFNTPLTFMQSQKYITLEKEKSMAILIYCTFL